MDGLDGGRPVLFATDPSPAGAALLQASSLRRSLDASIAGSQDDRADPALLKMMLKGKATVGQAGMRDNIRASWIERSGSAGQLHGAEGLWDPSQMGADADRDRDAPLSGAASPSLLINGLSGSPQLDTGLAGLTASATAAALDMELPDFRGKPVRTGSQLASMSAQAMSRNGSFNHSGAGLAVPPSAAAVAAAAIAASGGPLSREGSFSDHSFFNVPGSAPGTPHSPLTPMFDLGGGGAAGAPGGAAQLDAVSSSFGAKDGPGALGGRSSYSGLQPEPRAHKPSKLRISSSEYDVTSGTDYGPAAAAASAAAAVAASATAAGGAHMHHNMAAAVQQAAAAAAAAAAGMEGGYHPVQRAMGSSTPTLGSGAGSPEPGSLPAGAMHHQHSMHHMAMQQAAAFGGSGVGPNPPAYGHPPGVFAPPPPPHRPATAGTAMAAAAAAAAAAELQASGSGHMAGPAAMHAAMAAMSSHMPPQPQMHGMPGMGPNPQQQFQQQVQQAFMMGMNMASQAHGGAHAGPWPGAAPPLGTGGMPGFGGVPGYGMPAPGGMDGAGGGPPPYGAPGGVSSYGFPPKGPEAFAMWQNVWQQMQACGMNMGAPMNPMNTMAFAAAVAAATAAAAAANPEDKDAMGRGRDMHGMVDRVRMDRAPRGGRERAPGGRGTPRADDAHRCTNPLLEELKKSRKVEIKDVLGSVLDFSLDQHGSRFLQTKLDTLCPEDLATAFREMVPKAMTLMNDVFGNYVVQKVLELGPDEHREELAQLMRGHVLSLSLQMYSCRVVQRALEVCSMERRVSIVRELQDHTIRCVRDQNGNHVIQKCVECVPSEHLTTMLDTFNGQIVSLSMHSFGCRVVQRILEHCGGTPRYDAVMAEVMTAIIQLAQDQYGNYVIQHILVFGRPHERDAIISTLSPHVVQLSQNKFASNVVEKCLVHGRPDQRHAMVETILVGAAASTHATDSPLHQMMRDQFGNYVVQKLLEVCTEEQRERLLELLRQQLPFLKRLTYGKHIVNRLEKQLCSGVRISSSAAGGPPPPAPAAGAAPAGGGSTGATPRASDCAAGGADGLACGVSQLDLGRDTEALVAAAAAANAADERAAGEL